MTDWTKGFKYSAADMKKMAEENKMNTKFFQDNYPHKDVKIYLVSEVVFPELKVGQTCSFDYIVQLMNENPNFFITNECNDSEHIDLNVWEYYESFSHVILSFDFD